MTKVASRVERARGPVARFLGLMFRRGWGASDGLLLEGCNSIHTFFMRMPIDVAYLDREGRVVRVKTEMKPWRIGPIVWKAKSVLELPVGALVGVQPGDRLELGYSR